MCGYPNAYWFQQIKHRPLQMSMFYDRYKNLFMEDGFVRSRGSVPSSDSGYAFQSRLRTIEDKILRANKRNYSSFSLYNPEPHDQYNKNPPLQKNHHRPLVKLDTIRVVLQQPKQTKPEVEGGPYKPLAQSPPVKQTTRLPPISQGSSPEISHQRTQRAKTEPMVSFSPSFSPPKYRESDGYTNFLEFSEYKPQNNFEFLDKRMNDIKQINHYYNREKINEYTGALMRRRDRKRSPERKSRLHQMIQKQQGQLLDLDSYPNFHTSKL